jgi:hypothetical protein
MPDRNPTEPVCFHRKLIYFAQGYCNGYAIALVYLRITVISVYEYVIWYDTVLDVK